MKTISVSRHAKAPVERVFAVATDFAGAPGRLKAIKSLQVHTEGPVRVGTRFTETRVMMGRDASETMEVLALDPPRSYTLGAESHGCRYRTELRFTPKDGGTLIEMHFGYEPVTLVAKIMSVMLRFMTKTIVAQCGKDLEDIAAWSESHAGP